MRIDGLQCGHFNRQAFEELRAGGLGCVTNTIAVWENASETMAAIGRWRHLARENADLVTIARTTADIEAANASGRTAVLLGTQNSSPIEDRIDFVELFHDMGLRVMQLTYNIQNALGSSCYEPEDSGLTRFGRNVIAEMNRVGMVVDLSHVGDRTSHDAILASQRPVAINHANPRELFDHARNKRPKVLDTLAEHDGVLGLSMYPNIAGPYAGTLDKWCELVARTAERIGVRHVGVGSDLGRFMTTTDLDWMRRGRWTHGPEYGAGSPDRPGMVEDPEWFTTSADFAAIPGALRAAGFSAEETEAICGGNWLRLYREVIDLAS
ncbi:membrane dipeptidase [Acrocarpospora pleiomorpha]|uniref:Membrane dipeptidase n=1 Tax=Acrocarpospora pleiomorpha TaxID=90975 RepID=A0A5M3XGP6_9ACTN|nr:membrane dipeptidase [Acrocarpospora pleiomorpha]GES20725.1 membrane dipeptidase [Acrocarpospora pleiomorpha]